MPKKTQHTNVIQFEVLLRRFIVRKFSCAIYQKRDTQQRQSKGVVFVTWDILKKHFLALNKNYGNCKEKWILLVLKTQSFFGFKSFWKIIDRTQFCYMTFILKMLLVIFFLQLYIEIRFKTLNISIRSFFGFLFGFSSIVVANVTIR